jgi:tetratricopeptide (TPR) repeat protein
LNEQGFALIQAGEYEAAVPVLEEAVAAYPEGSEDLDYAYALFNLGNALRLSGHPEEAIPVLEKRLEIPNQTGTVEAELQQAREEAG